MKQFILLLISFFIVSAIPLSALSTPAPNSPKAVLDEFAKMEINGDLLTSDGWHKANLLFVHRNPFPQDRNITVISRDYSLREIPARGNHAQVLVTYKNFGNVDSASQYTPTAELSGKMALRSDPYSSPQNLKRVGGTIGQ